jgi:hypothetical protein
MIPKYIKYEHVLKAMHEAEKLGAYVWVLPIAKFGFVPGLLMRLKNLAF